MWVGSSISPLLGALLGARSFIADWGGGGGNLEGKNFAKNPLRKKGGNFSVKFWD